MFTRIFADVEGTVKNFICFSFIHNKHRAAAQGDEVDEEKQNLMHIMCTRQKLSLFHTHRVPYTHENEEYWAKKMKWASFFIRFGIHLRLAQFLMSFHRVEVRKNFIVTKQMNFTLSLLSRQSFYRGHLSDERSERRLKRANNSKTIFQAHPTSLWSSSLINAHLNGKRMWRRWRMLVWGHQKKVNHRIFSGDTFCACWRKLKSFQQNSKKRRFYEYI